MNEVVVRSSAWYGDKRFSLTFPDEWVVEERRMAGHAATPLSPDHFRERLNQPIGTKPLRDLAKDRSQCVIIVDDLMRPTKAFQILPVILDELHQGGLQKNQIRFVMGLGAHHYMLLDSLVKKLGADIPEQFCVFNHNVYENNIHLGETSFGTPVNINKEVMSCDLKIAVGGIIPHRNSGFSGGAKLILPGVASMETIVHNHRHVRQGRGEGRIELNETRLDIEEAAQMVGLDFIVNCIFNATRDWGDLVCGDFVKAHRVGVKLARQNYLTKVVQGADVVVVNGYPMESEAYKIFSLAIESVREGGDVVVLLNTLKGSRGHYYNGRFGLDYGGQGWSPEVYLRKPWKMARVIVVAPGHSLMEEWYFGKGSQWVKSWDEALTLLYKKQNPYDAVKAVVYPYAPLQVSEKIASYT